MNGTYDNYECVHNAYVNHKLVITGICYKDVYTGSGINVSGVHEHV